MSQHDPQPQVEMHAHADGHAEVFQVGQGSLNVTIYGASNQSPGASGVVKQIPPLVSTEGSGFVGRGQHVVHLLSLLDPAGSGPVATVVSAVAGMGGVGKTALAGHVAGLAVGRDWFPGGAVIINLHGYDPERRVEAGQVFGPMLHALDPGGQVPARADEQAAVYHRLLATRAEAGQRVLLVLDNASTADQVTGLLPRHVAHRVVVTSRHTLGDLDGVRVLDLNILDIGEAVDMVDRALRERDPADDRISDNPDHARVLVERCGRLPLALRIAAALLADDPSMTVTGLAGELVDTATGLNTLTYGRRAVAAAFDLSWRHLTERDPAAARLFRLLPVNPGPDISTEAAAALADLPASQVRVLLRVLRRAHLLEPGATPDRWPMHDLVSTYSTGLAEDHTGERAAATARLLDHYTTTAVAANEHLRALPAQAVPDRFTGREHALEWLDAERANLTAAVTLAAATGDHHTTLRLAVNLGEYLTVRRYLDDWVAVAATALAAAHHLNLHCEGTAWGNLGTALAGVRKFEEAITAHQHALEIYQHAGDRHGEGTAWNNLGLALHGLRKFKEAITACSRALEICQQTGDRHGEGRAWNNLGNVLTEVGRPDEAITAYQHDLEICQQTGDRHGEGTAWGNLGATLRQACRFDEAITAHQHALEICQQTGDRHGEGTAWNNLGNTLQEVGRFDEAITAHRTAGDIYRQTGDQHSEGAAWNNLGTTLVRARLFEEAITAHQHTLEICQQTEDRHGEGAAWGNLGAALWQVRRFEEAAAATEHAMAAFTETGAADDAEKARRLAQAIKEASSRADPEGHPSRSAAPGRTRT